MRVSHPLLLLCLLGLLHLSVSQITIGGGSEYQQGLVSGLGLAVGTAAVVGLGALAVHHFREKERQRDYARGFGYGYNPYHQQQPYRYQSQPYNNYQYQRQPQPYYPPGAYPHGHVRRRRSADDVQLKKSFEKIRSRDKNQCGMRLVCELEARRATGESLDDSAKLILSLFDDEPTPRSSADLLSAQGQYQYAALIGSQSRDTRTCANVYRSCILDSKVMLALVQAVREHRQ